MVQCFLARACAAGACLVQARATVPMEDDGGNYMEGGAAETAAPVNVQPGAGGARAWHAFQENRGVEDW